MAGIPRLCYGSLLCVRELEAAQGAITGRYAKSTLPVMQTYKEITQPPLTGQPQVARHAHIFHSLNGKFLELCVVYHILPM